ncbi:MAG: AlkZ-related protein [bacterium]
MRYAFTVRKKADVLRAVEEFGIVPYFATSIPGFSLAEHCPPEVLFSDTGDDTWSWKGPVIREAGCAYGKFFEKKAAWVRRDLFLDLANYRRDGYDFDARYEDGLAKAQDKELYDLIEANAPVLSRELRRLGGYAYAGRWQKTDGKKGFDTALTRLQEECYVLTGDFVYTLDKKGRPQGWGVAEYTTPEKLWGAAFTEEVYRRTPQESHARLLAHLKALFPEVAEEKLLRFLK